MYFICILGVCVCVCVCAFLGDVHVHVHACTLCNMNHGKSIEIKTVPNYNCGHNWSNSSINLLTILKSVDPLCH